MVQAACWGYLLAPLSEAREKIRRAILRKLMGWDEERLIGKTKLCIQAN